MKSPSVLVSVALCGVLLSGCGATDRAPENHPTPTASASATTEPSATATPTASTTKPSLVQKPAIALNLKVGWPDADSHGGAAITRPKLPGRQLIAPGCDQQALQAASAYTGQALEFLGPEDSRKRQVARFAEPAGARATMARVASEARSCPTRDQDGAKVITKVEQRRGSIVLTTHYTYDGEPAVGAASLVVLQQGNVVVLSSMAGEASGAEGARMLADIDLPHVRAILSQACAATRC